MIIGIFILLPCNLPGPEFRIFSMIRSCTWMLLLASQLFFSCHSSNAPVVDQRFIDSFLTHYRPSAAEKLDSADLLFWQARLTPTPDSYTATGRLAGTLVQRFHLYGDIDDLLRADSLLSGLSTALHGQEAGILRAMAIINITRHRFKQADSLVSAALTLGAEKYASTLLQFDTRFELGETTTASKALFSCAAGNEYGYFFRLAKWKHFQGETDSAVFYLDKALLWSGNSVYLRQAALSNMADLFMHEGKMEKAAALYTQSLALDAADWRSLQGLGRIALLHDNNPVRAEKIFGFIVTRNRLPDASYNLLWLAEQKADSIQIRETALRFVTMAEQGRYGTMYHKYLVDCYTSVLSSPAKALQIARSELENRATPQTYSWYAWSLHQNGQDEKAWQVYKSHVSGKPLEALELYWMGKMMLGMKKPYNANEFFRAADKNRFDLSPVIQRDLALLVK
jgi:tetratricopeptide (TPR) repeat protein